MSSTRQHPPVRPRKTVFRNLFRNVFERIELRSTSHLEPLKCWPLPVWSTQSRMRSENLSGGHNLFTHLFSIFVFISSPLSSFPHRCCGNASGLSSQVANQSLSDYRRFVDSGATRSSGSSIAADFFLRSVRVCYASLSTRLQSRYLRGKPLSLHVCGYHLIRESVSATTSFFHCCSCERTRVTVPYVS